MHIGMVLRRLLFALLLLGCVLPASATREYSERNYCELGSFPIVLLSRDNTTGDFTLIDRLHPLTQNLTEGDFRRLQSSDLISQQNVRSQWTPGITVGSKIYDRNMVEATGNKSNSSFFYARECGCFGPEYPIVYCPFAVETCLRPKRRNDDPTPACMNRTPGGGFGGGAFIMLIGLYTFALIYLLCSSMGINVLGFLAGRVSNRWNRRLVDRIMDEDPGQSRSLARRMFLERAEELQRMAQVEVRSAVDRGVICTPTSLVLRTKTFRQEDEDRGSDGTDNAAEDRQCAICYFPLEDGDKIGHLSCNHDFHASCLKSWLQRRNTCPLCQTQDIAEVRYDPVDRVDSNHSDANSETSEHSSTTET